MTELAQEHMAPMLTYREAATLLGVPIGTLYAWVHTRAIPHVRLGPRLVRFSRDALGHWLDARSVCEKATVTA